jgi:hypothetical protein
MQKLINYQIQHATENELLEYAKKYQVRLSTNEAKSIVHILRNNPIDIFNKQKRLKVLKIIAEDVNPTVAKKMNNIIEKVTD